MKFSALCYFTILQVVPLVLGFPAIQEKTFNNTNEIPEEILKNPGIRHLLDQIPKVLSRAELHDEGDEDDEDDAEQEEYPTDTELLLFAYCLSNQEEPSCAVFFRFAHYFFTGRVKTDPSLASVVEEEEEYSDIVYDTIEITQDVVTEVDVTVTYYETDSERYYADHPVSTINVSSRPSDIGDNGSSSGEVNNPITPTVLNTCPTQFITETITATDTVTYTAEPSYTDFDCSSFTSNTKAISCVKQNGFIQLNPAPNSCDQLNEYVGIYKPIFSSCFANSTQTVNGPPVTVTNGPVSTLSVGVYSTVTEGPATTVYTGNISTIYTGSISTVTATPTVIGAPVSTLTEMSTTTIFTGPTSTFTVGVYTTVTEEPGYTTTATPTVIGAPAATITEVDQVTIFTGSATTVTVGVYTTVTEGPVSTIYTGKISTITAGPVKTITASPPTIIGAPATTITKSAETITVTQIPNSDDVCKTNYTGNVTTVYTGKVTTITASPTKANDVPVATFTQYIPLINFNMLPIKGLIDSINGSFMAHAGDSRQPPECTDNSHGNGMSCNSTNKGSSMGSEDNPRNTAGESFLDKLKNYFGNDFVKDHGDLFGDFPLDSIGQKPKEGFGDGVYQNEGSIINDKDGTNIHNNSSVHNNGDKKETVPDTEREIVIQNIYNNYYGNDFGREYDRDFGNEEIQGHYVNFKGEQVWSSPFGLYFDNGTRVTFYTNCSFTGNIPKSPLKEENTLTGEYESSMMFASIDASSMLENPRDAFSNYQSHETENAYQLTQYYSTFCTDNEGNEEIIGDPVDCIIHTVTHPPYCSEFEEHSHDDFN